MKAPRTAGELETAGELVRVLGNLDPDTAVKFSISLTVEEDGIWNCDYSIPDDNLELDIFSPCLGCGDLCFHFSARISAQFQRWKQEIYSKCLEQYRLMIEPDFQSWLEYRATKTIEPECESSTERS